MCGSALGGGGMEADDGENKEAYGQGMRKWGRCSFSLSSPLDFHSVGYSGFSVLVYKFYSSSLGSL